MWCQNIIKLLEFSYFCYPFCYSMTQLMSYHTAASFQKGLIKDLSLFKRAKLTWLYCSGLKYCFEVGHPCQARKCKMSTRGKKLHVWKQLENLETIRKCQIFIAVWKICNSLWIFLLEHLHVEESEEFALETFLDRFLPPRAPSHEV